MTAVNLVSVNTAPERAAKVIGTVIENVKGKYDIVHAGNSTTIEGVKPLLESVQPPPGILFCASMVSWETRDEGDEGMCGLLTPTQWTPEEQEEIQRIARETVPGIRTHAIPTGLQVKVGPNGVVQYLMERIDEIMA